MQYWDPFPSGLIPIPTWTTSANGVKENIRLQIVAECTIKVEITSASTL